MNQNRVTQQDIDNLLAAAETQEHTFWDKELLVSYRLISGFTVTGRAAVVDPVNFDLEVGRRLCREDAEHQLWALEGYRKQLELSGQIRSLTIDPSLYGDNVEPLRLTDEEIRQLGGVSIMPEHPSDPGWLSRLTSQQIEPDHGPQESQR